MGYLLFIIRGLWLATVSPMLFKILLALSVGYHIHKGISQGLADIKKKP